MTRGVIAILAGLFLNGLLQAAETTILDRFSIGAQERQEGAALAGESAEVGNLIWNATDGLELVADGQEGRLGFFSQKSLVAHVALPHQTERLRLQARVSVQADKAGWIGIGFAAAPAVNWATGAFVNLESSGVAKAFANGTQQKLGQKPVPEYAPGQVVTISLEYNATDQTLSAWANETDIVTGVRIADETFSPQALVVGISSYGVNARSWADDFEAQCEGTGTAGAAAAAAKPAGVYRILFVGNSITRHGPSEKLKWNRTAGMAASSEAADYAHRLSTAIDEALADRRVEPVFMAHGGGVLPNSLAQLKNYQSLAPDVIVVQLGENDRETMGRDAFAENYLRLLQEAQAFPSKPLVLCTGVWSPGRKDGYSGWALAREEAIRTAAEQTGAHYVSVQQAAMSPECSGTGEVAGVRWHPNDAGMQAYAENLFAAWQQAYRQATLQ